MSAIPKIGPILFVSPDLYDFAVSTSHGKYPVFNVPDWGSNHWVFTYKSYIRMDDELVELTNRIAPELLQDKSTNDIQQP